MSTITIALSKGKLLAGTEALFRRYGLPFPMGDSRRLVDWGATARLGQLMVRREEQPWQSRCTLLLDTRRRAFAGGTRTAPNGSQQHRRGPCRHEGVVARRFRPDAEQPAVRQPHVSDGRPAEMNPRALEIAIRPGVDLHPRRT